MRVLSDEFGSRLAIWSSANLTSPPAMGSTATRSGGDAEVGKHALALQDAQFKSLDQPPSFRRLDVHRRRHLGDEAKLFIGGECGIPLANAVVRMVMALSTILSR